MSSSSFYDTDGGEEEGSCSGCLNAKMCVIFVCVLPILAGGILMSLSMADPCMEYNSKYRCTNALTNKDECCPQPCDSIKDTESSGCFETSLWTGFFTLGVVLCAAGIVILTAYIIGYKVREHRMQNDFVTVENSWGSENNSSKSYRREKNAYTVTYDTYPPTYHSHGPQ